MYNIIILIVFCVISLPVQLFAVMPNHLDAAYHEQYEQYIKEIESLQYSIADYQTCITDFDNVGKEYSSLNERTSNYTISRKEAAAEIVRLSEKNLAVLRQCMSTFNRVRGEQRSNISLDDVKEDMEYSRRRVKELTGKKQELKIKILEANGALPVWWVE